MTIRELMTTEVVAVPPTATVADVARAMRDQRVGSVLVMEDSYLLGIVSDRDLTVRAAAQGWSPSEHLISEIMTTDPITVDAADDPLEAAKIIGASHVRRLPVVEDGRTVGVISASDIADYIDEALAGLLEEMEKSVH